MKKLNDKVTIYKDRHSMIWEGRIVSMTKRTCGVTGKERTQFGLYVEREFRKPDYAASFRGHTIYASGKEVKDGWWVTEHDGVLVQLMDDYLDIADPIWKKQQSIVWDKHLRDTFNEANLQIGDVVSFAEPEAAPWQGIMTKIDKETLTMSARGINGYSDINNVRPDQGEFYK